MLGLCKVVLIGTVGEHITCRSHNGNLHSLHNRHSHSRVQLRPHACRSSHHGSHRSSCSLHSLRILHSHSRAQPQPHACRSSPCCIQDRNHHSLHILHGILRIHRIRIRHSLRIRHGSLHNLHSHS